MASFRNLQSLFLGRGRADRHNWMGSFRISLKECQILFDSLLANSLPNPAERLRLLPRPSLGLAAGLLFSLPAHITRDLALARLNPIPLSATVGQPGPFVPPEAVRARGDS